MINKKDYNQCQNKYNLDKDVEEWNKKNKGIKYIINGEKIKILDKEN